MGRDLVQYHPGCKSKNISWHNAGPLFHSAPAVRAKIKDPNYKAPADVNISQPKYVPQVRLGDAVVT